MPTTSPDNIAYPSTANSYNPVSDMAALASSVQTALGKREGYTYMWADAAARTAETGMVAMSLGFQSDTKVTYMYNGTAWKAWQTLEPVAFTPTWTSLTVGNGTQSWTYTIAAGLVTIQGFFTMGTTSSMGASPRMALPVPGNGLATGAPNSGNDQALGTVLLEDAGTILHTGVVLTHVASGVVRARMVAQNASGTYTYASDVSSTIPFTWATGDFMAATFTYRAD